MACRVRKTIADHDSMMSCSRGPTSCPPDSSRATAIIASISDRLMPSRNISSTTSTKPLHSGDALQQAHANSLECTWRPPAALSRKPPHEGCLSQANKSTFPARMPALDLPFLHGAVYFSLSTTLHASSAMWCMKCCKDITAGQKR